jgi:hypothetical protein
MSAFCRWPLPVESHKKFCEAPPRLGSSGKHLIKYTHLAPSDNRSTKSADGRVATEAAWLNGNNLEKEEIRKKKEKMKEQP